MASKPPSNKLKLRISANANNKKKIGSNKRNLEIDSDTANSKSKRPTLLNSNKKDSTFDSEADDSENDDSNSDQELDEEEECEEEEEGDEEDELDDEELSDEEIGSAIEEPTMYVRGEGSGNENKCGKSIDLPVYDDELSENGVSEAIEESIFYVYGEGNGNDCDVGNNDVKATESSSSGVTESQPVVSKPMFFFGQAGCLKLSPMTKPIVSAETKKSDEEQTSTTEKIDENVIRTVDSTEESSTNNLNANPDALEATSLSTQAKIDDQAEPDKEKLSTNDETTLSSESQNDVEHENEALNEQSKVNDSKTNDETENAINDAVPINENTTDKSTIESSSEINNADKPLEEHLESIEQQQSTNKEKETEKEVEGIELPIENIESNSSEALVNESVQENSSLIESETIAKTSEVLESTEQETENIISDNSENIGEKQSVEENEQTDPNEIKSEQKDESQIVLQYKNPITSNNIEGESNVDIISKSVKSSEDISKTIPIEIEHTSNAISPSQLNANIQNEKSEIIESHENLPAYVDSVATTSETTLNVNETIETAQEISKVENSDDVKQYLEDSSNPNELNDGILNSESNILEKSEEPIEKVVEQDILVANEEASTSLKDDANESIVCKPNVEIDNPNDEKIQELEPQNTLGIDHSESESKDEQIESLQQHPDELSVDLDTSNEISSIRQNQAIEEEKLVVKEEKLIGEEEETTIKDEENKVAIENEIDKSLTNDNSSIETEIKDIINEKVIESTIEKNDSKQEQEFLEESATSSSELLKDFTEKSTLSESIESPETHEKNTPIKEKRKSVDDIEEPFVCKKVYLCGEQSTDIAIKPLNEIQEQEIVLQSNVEVLVAPKMIEQKETTSQIESSCIPIENETPKDDLPLDRFDSTIKESFNENEVESIQTQNDELPTEENLTEIVPSKIEIEEELTSTKVNVDINQATESATPEIPETSSIENTQKLPESDVEQISETVCQVVKEKPASPKQSSTTIQLRNRKRRISTEKIRHSSESENDNFDPTIESPLSQNASSDEEVGGKRIKMRTKVVQKTVRKSVEQKRNVKDTDWSSDDNEKPNAKRSTNETTKESEKVSPPKTKSVEPTINKQSEEKIKIDGSSSENQENLEKNENQTIVKEENEHQSDDGTGKY